MIDNIVVTSRKFNRGICTQYDQIVFKITRQSENTAELVTLQDYVENLWCKELLQLKVREPGEFMSLNSLVDW